MYLQFAISFNIFFQIAIWMISLKDFILGIFCFKKNQQMTWKHAKLATMQS